ncbi:hypothetical protein D3C84_241710 [compost metagenome]
MKPLLPSSLMRLEKSPAAAAPTSAATSRSTWTSTVRSAHSTTEPRRSPSSLMTGLATRPKERPPTSICVLKVLVKVASRRFWCSGFLWNWSIEPPSNLLTEKLGRALRRSASAFCSMLVTVLFM